MGLRWHELHNAPRLEEASAAYPIGARVSYVTATEQYPQLCQRGTFVGTVLLDPLDARRWLPVHPAYAPAAAAPLLVRASDIVEIQPHP